MRQAYRPRGQQEAATVSGAPNPPPRGAADQVRVEHQREPAKALGLTIPQSLLHRTDEVIDEFAVSDLCQNHRTPSGAIGNDSRTGGAQRLRLFSMVSDNGR